VVLLVGDEILVPLDEGRDDALVGQVARGEGQAGLGPQVIGQLLLEQGVDRHRPVEEAGSRAARAELLGGLAGGLDDLGVLRQPQVVVAAGHEDVAALHLDHGTVVLLNGMEVGEDAGGDDLLSP
jgi:hypothetical protein